MAKKIDSTTKKLIITIVIYCALLVILTIALWPFVRKLADPVYQKEFSDWVSSLGIWGWLVVLGIQILQIVIAFIPGGAVEIIAGALYGTLGGLFVCLVGCLIASAFVFSLTRKFGMPLLYRFFGKEKVEGFTFLKDSRRIESVTFILFLIPGTPKDMLTYVAGVSSIRMSSFLLISMFARIPAMALTLMVGVNMGDGNWGMAIGLFALTAVIGLVGIKYKDRIISYCHTLGSKRKKGKSLPPPQSAGDAVDESHVSGK